MSDLAPSATGWRRLVGVLSLPRSGSTVFAAVLGAHSQVHEVYEPWNDRSAGLPLDAPTSFAAFTARFAPEPAGRSTLVVKETTTRLPLVDRLGDLLDDAPTGVSTHLLILLRNPFHAFLSMHQARREWWGSPDLALDLAGFNAWALPALGGLARLAAAARGRDTHLVSYDRLVRDPAAIPALMAAIGLDGEPGQARFGHTIDRTRVRGDPKMLGDVSEVSAAPADARSRQVAELRPMFQSSPHFPRIRRIARQIAAMPAVVSAADAEPLMAALAGSGGGRINGGRSGTGRKASRTPR